MEKARELKAARIGRGRGATDGQCAIGRPVAGHDFSNARRPAPAYRLMWRCARWVVTPCLLNSARPAIGPGVKTRWGYGQSIVALCR